jgi:hypothetical protein
MGHHALPSLQFSAKCDVSARASFVRARWGITGTLCETDAENGLLERYLRWG